jgi:hypothetical protein
MKADSDLAAIQLKLMKVGSVFQKIRFEGTICWGHGDPMNFLLVNISVLKKTEFEK